MIAKQQGVKAHKVLETSFFHFIERSTSDLAERYELVKAMPQDAMAVLNLIGTDGNEVLDGSVITNMGDQLQQYAQQDENELQTASDDAEAIHANVQLAMNQCQKEVRTLQSLSTQLQNQVNSIFNEFASEHDATDDETLFDTPPETSELEVALEEAATVLEECLLQVAATYEQMDEDSAPQPQNLNDYATLEQSYETLGNNLVTTANAYITSMDPNKIVKQFTLSPKTYLGFQRTILQELLPTDTTNPNFSLYHKIRPTQVN